MKTLIVIFLVSLEFWSCEKIVTAEGPISGNGIVTTQTRNMTGFSSLESRINANINIYKSDSFCIRVTASQNLLQYIHTSVINSNLIITTGGYQLFQQTPVTIDVFVPELNQIKLKGTGQIHSYCPVPKLVMTGSGNIRCDYAEKTACADILLTGSGLIDLSGMPVKTADVELSGTGSIRLNTSDHLNASISGTGTIYYKGTPLIEQHISGIGSIVKVE